MATPYGSKRIVVGAHYGMRDWLSQRATATLMAIFTVVLLVQLLLPFVIWLFDASVTSEISYERFTSAFVAGIGVLPGGGVKLVALALIWAYLFHFTAGVRHLWMDMTHSVSKQQGHSSALVVLVLSSLLTLLLGAKLFGLY